MIHEFWRLLRKFKYLCRTCFLFLLYLTLLAIWKQKTMLADLAHLDNFNWTSATLLCRFRENIAKSCPIHHCSFLVSNFPFEYSTFSRHPTVKWAQRTDRVYITIDLPDAQDVKLKLEPEGKFFFSATSGPDKIPYEVDIDLYDKVDVNVGAQL